MYVRKVSLLFLYKAIGFGANAPGLTIIPPVVGNGVGANVPDVTIVASGKDAYPPDVTIISPDIGDGKCQEREQVLGSCQDKAIPVERRTLYKGGCLHNISKQ